MNFKQLFRRGPRREEQEEISLEGRVFFALLEGNAHNVEVFLKRGADLKTLADANVVGVAAQAGHTEVVRVLLDAGIDVNLQASTVGASALIHAAHAGHVQTAQFLLERGADPQLMTHGGDFNALMLAAMEGHSAVVRVLLEAGASASAGGRSGATALWWAARSGDPESVKALIEAGADVNAAREDGVTPFHCARARGHEAVIDLLKKAGAQETSRPRRSLRQRVKWEVKRWGQWADRRRRRVVRGR
jgi:uncharacterized protein